MYRSGPYISPTVKGTWRTKDGKKRANHIQVFVDAIRQENCTNEPEYGRALIV
jgi:hypothetical protein